MLLLFGNQGEEVVTEFVALDNVALVKLPHNIVNIHLPPFQATSTTVTVAGATRITESTDTRVTRAGDTRVTRDTTETVIPELVAIKLPNGVININLPK